MSDIQNLTIDDLIPGRKTEELNITQSEDREFLITGAGGSIGSEIVRQLLNQNPKKIILLDISEYSLFRIYEEVKMIKSKNGFSTHLVPLLGNILDSGHLKRIFSEHVIDTIYHAAAFKHVPLVQDKNNISKSGATYPTHGNSGYNDRKFEDFQFYPSDTTSSTTAGDWVSIGSDKKTLRLGAKNGDKGDYIRVITAAQGNVAPVARNDSGTVNENSTLTVDDGDNPSNVSAVVHDTSPKDVSGEDTAPRGYNF